MLAGGLALLNGITGNIVRLGKGTLEGGIGVAADALPDGHHSVHTNRVGATTDLRGVMGAIDVAVGRVNLSAAVHDSRAAEALGTELQAGVGEAPIFAGGLACLNGATGYGHGSVEGTGIRVV